MTGSFKIYLSCICICLCLSSAPIKAQILQDTIALRLVKKNIDFIYNLQFDNVREVHSKISLLYPVHPVVFLLNGMMTYWENYPMLSKSPARDSFVADMRQCISLSENNKDTAYEAEYLLADLCAKGLLLMYYSDNDLIMEVIPLVTKTYKYLRRSFDFAPVCSDLYYFTGVYNFYREAYPKAYPVYKPIALLFPGGNSEVGLKQLHTAALNSIVLRAESYFLLTYIYLNFENNYPQAVFYSRSLHELYPDNIQYRAVYIKNLLLMKQYDEAEKLITESSDETGNKYFQAQLTIFKGILQEKKYLDNKLAQEYYKKGISDISNFDNYAREYSAYAYYGLSRISEANGEKHISKIYRKKALDMADFKKNNFDK
jgi:hypothetical protein